MHPFHRFLHRGLLFAGTGLLASAAVPYVPGATGHLTYRAASRNIEIPLRHVQFISGPDSFEKGKTIRRLLFSTGDLTDKIASCPEMGCIDQYMEGIQVDLPPGPRLTYWMSLNGQMVQYSGTVTRESLQLTTEKADHLAGKLKFDQSAAGGPVIEVTFDTHKGKTFTR